MISHDRYLNFMLRRMRHLVYLAYRDIAVANGFLISVPSVPAGWSKFCAGPTAEHLLSGKPAHDVVTLTNVVMRHFRIPSRSADTTDGANDTHAQQSHWLMTASRASVADTPQADTTADQLSRPPDYVLSLLRGIPIRLHVDEVAAAALLTMALNDNDVDAEHLIRCLRKPSWTVGVWSKTKGLLSSFGRLLESGVILPGQYRLRDGNNGVSFTGCTYPDGAVASQRTITSFVLRELQHVGPERTRRLVDKALKRRLPIVIGDEEGTSWPPRLLAGLDLVLRLPTLDASLLALVIELCTDLPAAETMAEIRRRRLVCNRLGLDHLILAIAHDRSVFDIVDRLISLVDESEEEAETEKQSNDVPLRTVRPGRDVKAKDESGGKAGKTRGADVIPPATPGSENALLTVEALAGYGPAKDWALGLKQDLALWQSGALKWVDMSTKLLLSGPPGVGKTTFARALCNSLQIPLHVSSVASWLEPGYLGEVLKRMSNAFLSAQGDVPAILFIDEFDGIGRRGDGTRAHDDYWTQVVNRSLELLDGAIRFEGLIVIAATNYPERIDRALLRSGRIEDHIAIPMPDTKALTEIIRFHLGSDLDVILSSRGPTDASVAKLQEGKVSVNV